MLHRLGCKACSLRVMPGRMEPTGSDRPLVYILGEAPGADEIKYGKQFIGKSGRLLRSRIPERWLDKIRWNNVVRSHPPKNRDPEREEIEACRPSIEADIEATKPLVIFGFGNIPLTWVSGFTGILLWRARRMPVRVGKHECWYYPMLHPAYLLRQGRRQNTEMSDTEIGSEAERMFVLDLEKAFEDVEKGLPKPDVHDEQRAREGVEIIGGGDKGVAAIVKMLSWASKQPLVGFDYETNCLRPYATGANVLSAAVSDGKRSIAFPFEHREAKFSESQLKTIREAWRNFLLAPNVKVSHNLNFELEWSAFCFGEDIIRKGHWEDTASQACIIDERKVKRPTGPFSLEWLVQQYFGFNIKAMAGVNVQNLDNEPLEKVLRYNAIDAKYHLLLYQKQNDIIQREGLDYAYELALRRVPAVVLTQLKGIPVDQEEVIKLQEKYDARLKGIEEEIAAQQIIKDFREEKLHEYKPLSNPDAFHLFATMLKRPECNIIDKYTKKPKMSCDEDVLGQIDHPMAKLLVEYRKANKMKSTYVDPLKAGNDHTVIYSDGLSHATFNTIFSEAGRLSCDSPNWQNFPKRDEEAKEVRKVVAASKDHTILAFDYGQIEARVVAMFTKDNNFCQALRENYDVHMEWAERIARAYPARIGGRDMLEGFKLVKDSKNKKRPEVKAVKNFRTDIKSVWTFPLFYGARVESAAGYLDIPLDVIQPLYREFWRQFAGVKDWQEEQLKFYQTYGYTECLTGRRRHGPLSTNRIYNSPVQGTAAEIVMDAMCRLSETGDPELQPEINIHDDLSFVRVDKKRADEVAEKILNVMLAVPFKFVNVPITVELAEGPNWLDMEDVGTFSSDTWFK